MRASVKLPGQLHLTIIINQHSEELGNLAESDDNLIPNCPLVPSFSPLRTASRGLFLTHCPGQTRSGLRASPQGTPEPPQRRCSAVHESPSWDLKPKCPVFALTAHHKACGRSRYRQTLEHIEVWWFQPH